MTTTYPSDGSPRPYRQIPLTQAQIGLIFTLLQEDIQRSVAAGEDPRSYEVVITSEVATTDELFRQFADLVSGGPPAFMVHLTPPERWASHGHER